MGSGVSFDRFFEAALFLGDHEVVDRFNGVAVKDLVAFAAGVQSDGRGEVGFADSDGSDKDDVAGVFDEAQGGEVFDVLATRVRLAIAI